MRCACVVMWESAVQIVLVEKLSRGEDTEREKMATEVRGIRVEGGLLLEEPLLRKARLGQHVRIVVREGEIRVLPDEEDWKEILDDLAGCLGEEPARNYDFKLEIGGFHEAR